jgi:hypothetical protein
VTQVSHLLVDLPSDTDNFSTPAAMLSDERRQVQNNNELPSAIKVTQFSREIEMNKL